jgi:hypothetical protein
MEITPGVLLAIVAGSSCLSYLIGEWAGRRCGICEGYGAVKWPDSPYFAKARGFLNRIRVRDGLATIENESLRLP